MLAPWAWEGGFFQRGPLAEISTGHLKHFWRGAESDEISFFLVETNKTTFLLKM